MPVNCSSWSGTSMLGMGTSAAATDARKFCVGADRRGAARRFRRMRRGGDGGESGCASLLAVAKDAPGSGVRGAPAEKPADRRGNGVDIAATKYCIST